MQADKPVNKTRAEGGAETRGPAKRYCCDCKGYSEPGTWNARGEVLMEGWCSNLAVPVYRDDEACDDFAARAPSEAKP